jgi:hypothetical protein
MRRLPILCLGATTLLGACAFDAAPERTVLRDDCDLRGVLPVLEDNRELDSACADGAGAGEGWRFAMRDGDGGDGPDGPGDDGPGDDGPGDDGNDGGAPPV